MLCLPITRWWADWNEGGFIWCKEDGNLVRSCKDSYHLDEPIFNVLLVIRRYCEHRSGIQIFEEVDHCGIDMVVNPWWGYCFIELGDNGQPPMGYYVVAMVVY